MTKDHCKDFACDIQKCLRHNNFDQAYCFDAIERMRRCCAIWKNNSLTCDGFIMDIAKYDETPLKGTNNLLNSTWYKTTKIL